MKRSDKIYFSFIFGLPAVVLSLFVLVPWVFNPHATTYDLPDLTTAPRLPAALKTLRFDGRVRYAIVTGRMPTYFLAGTVRQPDLDAFCTRLGIRLSLAFPPEGLAYYATHITDMDLDPKEFGFQPAGDFLRYSGCPSADPDMYYWIHYCPKTGRFVLETTRSMR